MIKAIFFDIDGTLYDADTNYINPSSVEAIRSLHEQGYILGLCTGRSINEIVSVPKALIGLPFDVYITSGGACSYLRDGTPLHETYFTKEDVERIQKFIESVDYPLDIEFIDKDGAGILWECGEMGKINFDWYHIPTPPMRLMNEESVSHFLFAFEEKHHYQAKPYLASLSYYTTSPYSLDVYPCGVNKAYGIKKVIAHFGLSMVEVMAFGDSNNDVEMVVSVGLGIAMGNGSEEVSKLAKDVTASMQEDGIIKALQKYEVLV